MNAVWIVDDDRSIRWVLEKALAREEIPYKSFGSAGRGAGGAGGYAAAARVLVSDIRMPGESGCRCCPRSRRAFRTCRSSS
jgi:two-component system nitrogen regulation response regulator GlnG